MTEEYVSKEEMLNLINFATTGSGDPMLLAETGKKVGDQYLESMRKSIKEQKIDEEELENYAQDLANQANHEMEVRYKTGTSHEEAKGQEIAKGISPVRVILVEKRIDEFLKAAEGLHRHYQLMVNEIPTIIKSKYWVETQQVFEKATNHAINDVVTMFIGSVFPGWSRFREAVEEKLQTYGKYEEKLNQSLGKWQKSFKNELDHHFWLYLIYTGIISTASRLRSNFHPEDQLNLLHEMRFWALALKEWTDHAMRLYIDNPAIQEEIKFAEIMEHGVPEGKIELPLTKGIAKLIKMFFSSSYRNLINTIPQVYSQLIETVEDIEKIAQTLVQLNANVREDMLQSEEELKASVAKTRKRTKENTEKARKAVAEVIQTLREIAERGCGDYTGRETMAQINACVVKLSEAGLQLLAESIKQNSKYEFEKYFNEVFFNVLTKKLEELTAKAEA